MKKDGVYYIPNADKIIVIKDCEYYTYRETPTPFSLVTWIDVNGEFPRTAVFKAAYGNFIWIGDL